MISVVVASISAAIWLYLVFGRAFWHLSERDDWEHVPLTAWPRVAVVVPARNEADCVGQGLGSILCQDYPGDWTVILVDDGSTDGTAERARGAAQTLGEEQRLQVIAGAPLPSGWTGKLWAVKQGIDAASAGNPDYLLLTDADIVYRPEVLTRLVSRAKIRGLVLTSLMVKLRRVSFAERALIPAFIFFFQKLYPFSWVNRTGDPTAAAAGGCMLVHTDTLRKAGGIDRIRGALIDDCALAAIMKAYGPIWLGLTSHVRSIRAYPHVEDIRRMVARSAYAQLRYSPLMLAGMVVGMALTYLVPPLMTLFGNDTASLIGLSAWALMALAFQPTLRFYDLSPLWGIALPAIALCYLVFTLDSALQYVNGKGGMWKGRAQASGPS